MKFFTTKDIRFLKKIRNRIDALPWNIWEYDDTKDEPKYNKKRKELKGEVMHIQNQIKSYILAKYGESGLLRDFSCCSFFPRGFITDPFNDENNRAWSKGKKSFLYFTDELIDFAEAEESMNSIDWRNNITKWLILFVIIVVLMFILLGGTVLSGTTTAAFSYESKLKVFLIAIMITSNLLWHKNWRDLLPITTAIIGALLGSYI